MPIVLARKSTLSPTDEKTLASVKRKVDRLKGYDDAYYNSGAPKVSDSEYDSLKEKTEAFAKRLQKKGIDVSFAMKYLASIGANVRESKRSEKLPIEVGSLKKVKSNSDSALANFISSARKASAKIAVSLNKKNIKKNKEKVVEHYQSSVSLVASPKLDGLSLLLCYEKGKFKKAWSRGNGDTGVDKTEHAKALIKKGKLKEKLDPKSFSGFTYSQILISGEVVCRKADFKKVLKKLKGTKDETRFNYIRNSASGWMNSDSTDSPILEALDFVAYNAHSTHGDLGVEKAFEELSLGSNSKSNKIETLAKLKASGFKTYVDTNMFYVATVSGPSDALKKQLDKMLASLDSYEYPLDGIVLEVSDSLIRKQLGSHNKRPKYAIAYKVAAEDAVLSEGKDSVVTEIEYNPSKVGALKPTLIYKAVNFDGRNFSQATGNNIAWLIAKGIGPGAKIKVVAAGGVIPKTFLAGPKVSSSSIIPKKCSCGAPAIKVKNEKGSYYPDYFCSKPEKCKYVKREQLFMAIKSLKIVGLGSKNVDKLFAAGFRDIFELIEVARSKSTARKRITEIPGFGESMLSTVGVGIPKALNRLDLPELMEMSGVFVQPGLALAKVSFDKIYAATKGKCESSSDKAKIMKAVGPAKGKVFINKYSEWKRWYSKLKSLKD